ncbi:hypothetical protein LguiA_008876 [Lonicera macranthoides]
MVFNPPELSLNFRNNNNTYYVPKTISEFMGQLSAIGNRSERLLKLDEFVKRLEDEMRKIDVFKRELPLSILLINDVITALKEESMQCRKSNMEPVLEEFIPLKKTCDADEKGDDSRKEMDCRDKRNWLSSVQLWNSAACPTTDSSHHRKQNSRVEIKKSAEKEKRRVMDDKKGFMPFKGYSSFHVGEANKEDKEGLPTEGLSLLTPRIKNSKEELGYRGLSYKTSCSRAISSSSIDDRPNLRTGTQSSQTSRKQRRCWSPELHRRFVNALQQLGGSQVATPKQIRELMQVDGLTNDEVKSHLQKYRLHTRKVPTTNGDTSNQSALLLGGLQMPRDEHGESSNQSNSDSGSPEGPLHLTGPTGGTSTTGVDSMENEEDRKSESHSWKSHIHAS